MLSNHQACIWSVCMTSASFIILAIFTGVCWIWFAAWAGDKVSDWAESMFNISAATAAAIQCAVTLGVIFLPAFLFSLNWS